MRRLRRERAGSRGRGDLRQPGRSGQAADERRRGQRVQVGLPGEPRIDRLELPGCREEQGGRVGAVTGGERHLAAQQAHPGTQEHVRWSGFRPG